MNMHPVNISALITGKQRQIGPSRRTSIDWLGLNTCCQLVSYNILVRLRYGCNWRVGTGGDGGQQARVGVLDGGGWGGALEPEGGEAGEGSEGLQERAAARTVDAIGPAASRNSREVRRVRRGCG